MICPVCAEHGTAKEFKSLGGLETHLRAHRTAGLDPPEAFWQQQALIKRCRVCSDIFKNPGSRPQSCCTKHRKGD